MDLGHWLTLADRCIRKWEKRWGAFRRHDSLQVETQALRRAFAAYVRRLEGNYPFFHPAYAGQMLKPPHPVAILGYLAAMRINPNNHALDGGPPTAAMEKEVVRQLARMFDYPRTALGHLTSSGTIANLEALFVARELHPAKTVVVSHEAHYTHARMAHLLGLRVVPVQTDERGRMDLEALASILQTGRVGTAVMTAGTTSLGAVDPVKDAVSLCRRYGVRVHVDAAYGGFFRLLKNTGHLAADVARNLAAISAADSIVLDPHKHGLQPYGCGCVLFKDPSVGRFYKHDSPYTYFTSNDLHLGEISLECSRAGAAAGALWLTLQVLPLEVSRGFGPVLAACLRAARIWEHAVEQAECLQLWLSGDLDIATYCAKPDRMAMSRLDIAAGRLFERAMEADSESVYLSLLRTEATAVKARFPDMELDQPHTRILRSVLMRPEQEYHAEKLVARLNFLAT